MVLLIDLNLPHDLPSSIYSRLHTVNLPYRSDMTQRQIDQKNLKCFPISTTKRVWIKKERIVIGCDYGKTVERTQTIRLSLMEWTILNTSVQNIYKLLGFNHPLSEEGITLPISQYKWLKVNLNYIRINITCGKRRLFIVFTHDEWDKFAKSVTNLMSNK